MAFFSTINRWLKKVLLVLLIVDYTAFLLTGAYQIAHVQKQVYNERNCSRPQTRIAYLEDEYPDYNPVAVYLPHAAIVQRCDNSIGCCEKGTRYVSTRQEKMAFAFHELLDGNKTRKSVTMTNHLHCECHTIWQPK